MSFLLTQSRRKYQKMSVSIKKELFELASFLGMQPHARLLYIVLGIEVIESEQEDRGIGFKEVLKKTGLMGHQASEAMEELEGVGFVSRSEDKRDIMLQYAKEHFVFKETLSKRQESVKVRDMAYRVYRYWCKVMEKDPKKTKFTDKRKACVKARIKAGYSIEDMCLAVDGCKSSDFHMGDNDRDRTYNDLTLIFRNDDKLEEFREMGESAKNVKVVEMFDTERHEMLEAARRRSEAYQGEF